MMSRALTHSSPIREADAAPFGCEGAGATRVLVVDDDPDVRESAMLVLRLEGCAVEGAACAAEALDRLGRFRPHLAFVDIGLGVDNGYDLARRMREAPEGRELLLVALSGYGDNGRSGEAGFDVFLTKPVDPDAMLALVQRAGAAEPRH